MIIGENRHILKTFKKLKSARWLKKQEKELASDVIQSSLKNALFLVKYSPALTPRQKAAQEIHKEMDGFNIYFPIESLQNVILGFGGSDDQLHYFESATFDNPEDAINIKGILIGLKSLGQMLSKNMKPAKVIIETAHIDVDGNSVYTTGSITSKEFNELADFSKKQFIAFQKVQSERWKTHGKQDENNDDYEARQKKQKKEFIELVQPVMKAFAKKSYKKLSPHIAKKLKPKLDKTEFKSLAQKINELGKVKKIEVEYSADQFERSGKQIFSSSVKITFEKSGEATVRNAYFKFIKENKKYKLLKFDIYDY